MTYTREFRSNHIRHNNKYYLHFRIQGAYDDREKDKEKERDTDEGSKETDKRTEAEEKKQF
jgi:hypothetical protein